MLLEGFNANDVEPSRDFEALAEGWYVAMITESEQKPTKAGDGSYLSLTWEIDEGPAKGRKIWENLNLDNPNPKAVEIATRNLGDICRATGIMAPKNSEELHYKRIAIRLAVKEYNGEKKNEVKGHRAIKAGTESAAPASSSKPASATPAAPAKPAAPPWQRKAS